MSSSGYHNGPSAEAGHPSNYGGTWSGDPKKVVEHDTTGTDAGTFNDSEPEAHERPAPFPFNKVMNSSFGRSPWKNHFIAMVGELIGTASFLFFGMAGAEVANYAKSSGQSDAFDPAAVLYISTAFGLSLMVNVFIFFRVSGGLFNPAVTLAMLLTGAIPAMRCLCLFIAQMLGCMFSAYIVSVIVPTPFGVVTAPSNGATTAQAVCLEMILTAYLITTIFMLAGENHRGRFMAPVAIGMALFGSHLVAVQWTGASLNPARSFGPAVVSGTWTQHWIYCEFLLFRIR
ncbi:aquaporin [Phyllosticta citriasiana]|uniref:Aquaporin n=1 Tax=Phyllosticta citriasiana TaxID=595635 RepID=A0ABR1K8Q8_9PEZI